MRYSQLSGQQILLALSDSHNVIAAITKYQASLASGTGLPIDDTPRIELMAANLKVVEKIRTEIRALEHELDRQEAGEKSPLNTHWVRNADAADTVPRDESATCAAELACNE